MLVDSLLGLHVSSRLVWLFRCRLVQRGEIDKARDVLYWVRLNMRGDAVRCALLGSLPLFWQPACADPPLFALCVCVRTCSNITREQRDIAEAEMDEMQHAIRYSPRFARVSSAPSLC